MYKESHWYSIEVCNNCEKQLSNYQKMHSSGVCPYCGYKGPNAVTICKTQTLILKKIIKGNPLLFWKKLDIKFKAGNHITELWLKKK